MNKWLGKLVLVLLGAGLMVGMAGGVGWAKNPQNVVYVIGDSLSDPGNLFALTGIWPPSPPYAQRSCNGPVWPEYLAASMGITVDSRAYSGAFSGILLNEGVPVSNFNSVQNPPAIPGLPGVYEEVESLLDENPEGLNPRALYVVWAGANDFFLGLLQDQQYPQQGKLQLALAQAIENIADSVCKLAAAGARHFAVGNLPDIGMTPFARTLGSDYQAAFSLAVVQFNAALEMILVKLPPSCAETLVVFDAYQLLQDITADPAVYGLANVTDACLNFAAGMPPMVCTNPAEYMFWDSVHPTTAVQAILAAKFRSDFCATGELHPGLRGRTTVKPPAAWRGVCFGTK